jgi:hypothetical protein
MRDLRQRNVCHLHLVEDFLQIGTLEMPFLSGWSGSQSRKMGTDDRAWNNESFVQPAISLICTELRQTDDAGQLLRIGEKHWRPARSLGEPEAHLICAGELPAGIPIDVVADRSVDTHVANRARVSWIRPTIPAIAYAGPTSLPSLTATWRNMVSMIG